MAFQIKRVVPADVRTAVVQFFWRIRAWPYASEEEYFRYWDWRYSSLSESDPAVWIATDKDEVVGHLAVNFRHMQLDGQDVRLGIPANFRIDPRFRNSMVGTALVRAQQRLVRDREVDILLGYSTEAAHSLALALGSRDLGRLRVFLDVRDWRAVLQRRVRAAAFLAPLARLATNARESLRGVRRTGPPPGFSVRDLSVDELVALDRSAWKRPRGLVWNGSSTYLANRFLRCPFREYRVIAVVDDASRRIEGLVVAEGTSRLNVLLCVANAKALSEVAAVETVAASRREVETVMAPLLPQSDLAQSFEMAGYLPRWRASTDWVLRSTAWHAYWQPEHPLAERFGETHRWRLWSEWSQN